MWIVTLRKDFTEIEFKFNNLEDVTVFAGTALRNSNGVKVTIELSKEAGEE